MDDGKLSVSVSDERREFIAGELAAGTYADEAELVNAALELLENRKKIDLLRALIAEGDADFQAGRVHPVSNASELVDLVLSRSKQTQQ